jgi:diguanylate cyclase (GGDEF)-like protein/putative nucleotidyltransferase with HDIG domain
MERLNTELFLPLGVIMIDVNGLKLTNDVFGHLAGDALLIKIVGILKLVGLHTEDDFIARIGGDEFAIICPNIQDNEIEAIIMNINERTKNNFVNELPISLSLGWDIRETMANTWEETFISAENKMYRMKLTESKRIRNQIIQIAMKSLNQKNINERKHSLCVGALSGMIAEFMGLSKEAIKTAETAGLLHDIGKIAVQQELLSKPGLLTEKEFEELKKHSENGYQILRSVDSYSHLADIVLSHHERMDGKGYPRGFMEEEIPIASRIISIAEAYEALRIDRPYHKGVNHKEATREILANAGSQFDERIVRVFIEKFKEEDFLEKCQGGIINE